MVLWTYKTLTHKKKKLEEKKAWDGDFCEIELNVNDMRHPERLARTDDLKQPTATRPRFHFIRNIPQMLHEMNSNYQNRSTTQPLVLSKQKDFNFLYFSFYSYENNFYVFFIAIISKYSEFDSVSIQPTERIQNSEDFEACHSDGEEIW